MCLLEKEHCYLISNFFQNLIQDRCAPDPELISSSSPCIGHVRDTLYTQRTRKKVASHDEADDDEEDHLLEFQSTKPPGKIDSFA